MTLLAVIRVKGGFKIRQVFKDTLSMLRLNKKHHCVLLEDTPVNVGMIKKVREWVTWGEINADTLKELLKKRARLPGNKRLNISDKELDNLVSKLINGKTTLINEGIKPVLRLTPPKKGWEHGTIKLPYPRGALGPRGEDINKLILRMI